MRFGSARERSSSWWVCVASSLLLLQVGCAAPDFIAEARDAGANEPLFDGSADAASISETADGEATNATDATDHVDSEPTADAGYGGGRDAQIETEIVLSAPDVVATGTCMRLLVTRSSSDSSARSLSFDASGASLFANETCSTELVDPKLTQGETSLAAYVMPTLPNGTSVLSHKYRVSTDQGVTSETEVQVRLRALDVARGFEAGCALLADGSVFCAGSTVYSRLGRPYDGVQALPVRATGVASLSVAAKLSSLEDYTCVLNLEDASDSAGSVSCWGRGHLGQLGNGARNELSSAVDVVGLPQGGVTQLSVGVVHACALSAQHEVYCWGDNSGHEISARDDAVYHRATRSSTADGFAGQVVEVGAGWSNTCVRTSDGRVFCWGSGALGKEGLRESATPIEVSLPSAAKAKRIALGSTLACAVLESDDVYCWGISAGPSKVSGLPKGQPIARVSASFGTACFQAANDLYCYGDNTLGWLGTGSSKPRLTAAEKVQLPSGKLEAFAVGESPGSTVWAIVDGLVYAWGYSAVGALGLDVGFTPIARPTLSAALQPLDASEAALDGDVSCAVDGGALSCWGIGGYGELGNGTIDLAAGALAQAPLRVLGMDSGVSAVELGAHLVVASKDGEAYAWGLGNFGQIGNGSTANTPTPSKVALPGSVLDLAAAPYAACALVQTAPEKRAVYCWGRWGAASLATPVKVHEGDELLTEVDLYNGGGCLLERGVARCFSDDTFTLSTPNGLSDNVASLSANGTTLCARKYDDSGLCAFGQGASPSSVFAKILQLRAGDRHACAITNTGSVVCAGSDQFGQLGDGHIATNAGLSGAVSVQGLVGVATRLAVGGNTSCARDQEGWKCWGSNFNNATGAAPWAITKPTLVAPWQAQ